MTESFIIIYIIFLACYGLFSAAGIYHLRRYGYSGDLSKVAIVVYLIASVGVILPVVFWLASNYFI